MAEYGAVAPPDIMPKAKAAAERGVELDPSVGGQAQTTLAHIQAFFDWDWEGAEKGFLKAVESDPRYPFSRLLISGMRCCSLRWEDTRKPWPKKSAPRSSTHSPPSLNNNIGTICYYARRHDEAIAQYQKTLELAPEFARTHYFLALAYLATKRYDEAIAELEDTIKLSDENAVLLGTLAHALARAGREQDARHALQRLEERSAKEYVPALSRALAHIGLGQSNEAFAELDRAFTERSSWLLSLNVEPLFDPIRQDPRFQELVDRVGLPSREEE